MKQKNNLSLISGNIYKGLLLFVVPIIAGSLIQQLYTTIDAVIVGQFLGKNGLAAIDSVSTIFRFPVNFMNGLASGASIIISKYFGASKNKDLKLSIKAAFLVAVFLGIICSFSGVVFTSSILHVMAVPDDIFNMSLVYCRVYFSGLWSLILYNITAGILRALGDSKSPLYVLIFCCGLNIVADIVLIGIFNFGVAGAAFATVFSQAVSVIISLYILLKSLKKYPSDYKSESPAFQSYFVNIIVTGIPLAFQSILFPVANSIVQSSINQLGTDIIASWAICGKLDLIIWLIADSMSPALTTYISQNTGAGKVERIKKGIMAGTSMSVFFTGLCSIILFFFSSDIAGLFLAAGDTVTIIPLVTKYMRMMAPFYFTYAIAEALSGAYCGTGNTVKPMIATLISTCFLRIISILLIFSRFRTMECIIAIYISSWIASAIIFLLMFSKKFKKM
ncbi:MAG: MATE family efflux transporter [Treponema sp.]|nr:MATE family efflux transporter [Treponema sp.]